MSTGDIAEIEFQTPRRGRVLGVVRHRAGYCFGMELLCPLSSENDVTAGMQWSAVNLVRTAAEVADKVKLAENGAATFAVLEEVLLSEGKPRESQQAAAKTAALRQQLQEVYSVLQETKDEIRRILAALEQSPVLNADSQCHSLDKKPLTFAAASASSMIDISQFSRD